MFKYFYFRLSQCEYLLKQKISFLDRTTYIKCYLQKSKNFSLFYSQCNLSWFSGCSVQHCNSGTENTKSSVVPIPLFFHRQSQNPLNYHIEFLIHYMMASHFSILKMVFVLFHMQFITEFLGMFKYIFLSESLLFFLLVSPYILKYQCNKTRKLEISNLKS